MHPFAKDMLGSSLPSNAFAVVGSACLVSSATHTVAIIVIVFELTNNIQLLYPCMVGVLTTYITSKFFTISIYYVIVDIKNLDFLPKLLKATMYNKQAH
jgi:H+/Cl- antiporter ClcA